MRRPDYPRRLMALAMNRRIKPVWRRLIDATDCPRRRLEWLRVLSQPTGKSPNTIHRAKAEARGPHARLWILARKKARKGYRYQGGFVNAWYRR